MKKLIVNIYNKILFVVMCIAIGNALTACGQNIEQADKVAAVPQTSANIVKEPVEDSSDSQVAQIEVELVGGSGKAKINSPALVNITNEKKILRVVWSSPNYDYMIVAGEKFLPVNTSGNSVFEIPVDELEGELCVIADTTAMSTPHEIQYSICFDKSTINQVDSSLWDGSNDDSAVAENSDVKATELLVEYEIPDQIGDISHEGILELKYARCFRVDYYSEDYVLLSIADEGQFLILPEGISLNEVTLPDNLSEKLTIIERPELAYVAATGIMDMLAAIDGMDLVKFSSLNEDGWHIESARSQMEQGKLIYSGKYSAPDYELLISEGCDLAIENTMIYHSPAVKEKLEAFGIPVIVEKSSYESDPRGRMEWVKLFAELFGKRENAKIVFEKQLSACDTAIEKGSEDKKKSIAFFYIASNGNAVVRNSSDYIPRMIELAGGTYAFDNVTGGGSNINMQFEEFYSRVKDADIIIYNSTIDGGVSDLEELVAKNSLLKNVSAVQNKQVYCTQKDFYQSTMAVGDIISDISSIVNGEDEVGFFYRLR